MNSTTIFGYIAMALLTLSSCKPPAKDSQRWHKVYQSTFCLALDPLQSVSDAFFEQSLAQLASMQQQTKKTGAELNIYCQQRAAGQVPAMPALDLSSLSPDPLQHFAIELDAKFDTLYSLAPNDVELPLEHRFKTRLPKRSAHAILKSCDYKAEAERQESSQQAMNQAITAQKKRCAELKP